MTSSEREKHIKNLSYIMDSMPDDACGDWRDSLAFAISSIKTDLKYDLMYEGKEIYTKAEMVAMLEQLDLEIQEQIAFMGDGEETNGMKRADNIVKDKINALKQSIWQDNYNGKKE